MTLLLREMIRTCTVLLCYLHIVYAAGESGPRFSAIAHEARLGRAEVNMNRTMSVSTIQTPANGSIPSERNAAIVVGKVYYKTNDYEIFANNVSTTYEQSPDIADSFGVDTGSSLVQANQTQPTRPQRQLQLSTRKVAFAASLAILGVACFCLFFPGDRSDLVGASDSSEFSWESFSSLIFLLPLAKSFGLFSFSQGKSQYKAFSPRFEFELLNVCDDEDVRALQTFVNSSVSLPKTPLSSSSIDSVETHEKFSQGLSWLRHLFMEEVMNITVTNKTDANLELDNENGRAFLIRFDVDSPETDDQRFLDFRDSVNLLKRVVRPRDEVILSINSPGGSVDKYGLATSQFASLQEYTLNTTVLVDKMCCSGGYMIACTASRIIAAPFARVGSIGVIAQLLNFHQGLKNLGIEGHVLTAGNEKAPVTPFGKITEEGLRSQNELLAEVHNAFKHHVFKFRSKVDQLEVSFFF